MKGGGEGYTDKPAESGRADACLSRARGIPDV
jgi:hypothetical protein